MADERAPKLTTAVIVDTAIDVADRDGLPALSMRRIADELGVGAMSLYRHIADKDALLEAMAEEIGRRFPYPVDDPGPWSWRERVAIAVDVDWQLYRRHPWVVLALLGAALQLRCRRTRGARLARGGFHRPRRRHHHGYRDGTRGVELRQRRRARTGQ